MSVRQNRFTDWLGSWIGDDSAESAAVRSAQVAVLVRGTRTMIAGVLFNSAVTLAVLWNEVPRPWLFAWCGLIWIFGSHRIYRWWRHRGRTPRSEARPQTLVRSVAWSGVSGVLWGLAGIGVPLLAEPLHALQYNFLAFVIGGQVAAAATWLAPLFPAYFMFMAFSLGPLLAGLMWTGETIALGMALLTMALTAALTQYSHRAGRTFRQRVLDGLERERLIATLRAAHHDMEAQVRQRTSALENSNARLSAEVAERERAERDLRAQQALLHCVIDAIPMRVSVKDREGRRLLANRMMRDAFGLGAGDPLPTPEELSLVVPQDVASVLEKQQRVLSGEVLSYERHRELADGREEWSQVNWAPVRDPEQGIIGTVIVTADVTERKLWEQELSNFFDLSQDIHMICTLEGQVHRANRAMETILGTPLSDLQQEDLRARVHPDDRERLESAIEQLSGSETVLDLDLRMRLADGRYRRLSWRATRDEGTGFIFAVGRDVTEARQAQDELAANQRLLRTVFDSVPSLLWVKDAQSRYLMVNRAMARFFQHNPSEFVGRAAESITGESDWSSRFEAQDRRVLESGKASHDVVDAVLRDGRRVYMDIVRAPLHDESRKVVGVVGTAVDTTERVRLEAQLRQAQKMEAVGQLAGGVAHEFNNLLQVIMGHAQIAQRHLSDPERVSQYLQQVSRSAEGAAAITRRLLTFSRREALHPQRLDVNAQVRELFEMVRRLIPASIEPRLELSDVAAVEADPGQFQQALMNLCVNARDAMPEGGELVLRTEAWGCTEATPTMHGSIPAGNYVCIGVLDTGQGMTSEVLERIFEPFFTTKEIGRGTGLGLSMVYGFAQESGGYLDVQSTPEAGSAFLLYMPAMDAAQAASVPVSDAPRRGEGQCILVAEDEDAVRDLLVTLLKAEGYEVLEARDGAEAERIFEDHCARIAMAVLDMVMPKRSGRDVFEAIRARRPELPVLFSTGYADRYLDDAPLRDGFVPVIQKPYSPTDLLAAVQAGLSEQAKSPDA